MTTVATANPGIRISRQALRLAALALALAGLPGCQSINANGSNTEDRPAQAAAPTPNSASSTPRPTPRPRLLPQQQRLAYNLGFGTVTSYVPLSAGSYTVAATPPAPPRLSSPPTPPSVRQAIYGPDRQRPGQLCRKPSSRTSPSPRHRPGLLPHHRSGHQNRRRRHLPHPSGYTLLNTLPFRQNVTFSTNTGYFNYPAGTYAIAMLPTGTVPIATTLTLYSGAQFTYAAGAVRTIILVDVQVTTPPPPTSHRRRLRLMLSALQKA